MTQTNAILKFLQTGVSISPLEALNLFGCFRLGARVWELREAGYPITGEFVTENGKKFKRYWL